MPALNHLHIYKRMKDRPEYYQCIHPRCTHYVHKRHLEGKAASCPKCLQEYKLTLELLKLRTPHCEDCTNSPKAKAKKAVDAKLTGANVLNILSSLFTEENGK